MHLNQEMTDYKHYALQNLEDWIHDCLSSGDSTPQEIYKTITKIVQDSYDYHKKCFDDANELLNLLNGNETFEFSLPNNENKWIVPVEEFAGTDELLITFPEDLIEKVGWKEGDTLNWKDNGDGSFTLKKVWQDPYAEEMTKAGYEKVDGVWTLG
jgi:hypothetical protein